MLYKGGEVKMKKIVIVLLAVVALTSLCYAADDKPKATEPVGAVVETASVIVGKIAGVVSDATGTGKGSIKIESATGETKVVAIDESVKILDNTLNTITLNQLKQGEKVKVESSKEGKTTVSVEK
jgi:hypothetical protein